VKGIGQGHFSLDVDAFRSGLAQVGNKESGNGRQDRLLNFVFQRM